MQGEAVVPPWAVFKVVTTHGCRFQIACDLEATAETDPVAVSYRAGSLTHLDLLLEIAQAVLAPGDRVLDLGAHLGGFALACAALGCEVLAVEASPRNAELLELSARRNRFQKVQVVQAAVSDQNGSLDFSCHGPWGHVATPATGMPAITVPAARVDDLLERRGWDGVQFVKLDVEGSELRALRGMQRLLQRSDAPMIYFESNKYTLGLYGQNEEELKAEFRRLGFALFEVRPGEVRQLREGEKQVVVNTDYLAAKRLPPRLQAWERRGLSRLLRRLRRFAGRIARRVLHRKRA